MLLFLPIILTSRKKKLRNLTVIFRCSSNIPKKPAQQGEIQYEEAPVQGETYVSYLLRKWGFLACTRYLLFFRQYEYHDNQDGMVYKQEQYEQEHDQYQEYDQHGNPIHRDDQENGMLCLFSD